MIKFKVYSKYEENLSHKLDILLLYADSLVRERESVIRDIKQMNENLKNDDVFSLRTKTNIQGCENLDGIKIDNNENKTEEKRRRFSEVGSLFHKSVETFSELKEQNLNHQRNKRKKEVSFRFFNHFIILMIKPFIYTFSNMIEEDVIMEQPDTALDDIGEDQQLQGLENNIEEKYWMDNIEIDPEHIVNVLRYAFAICLVAVSAKLLFDVFFLPN